VADREFVEMVNNCSRSFLLVDLLLCCMYYLLLSTLSFGKRGAAKYLAQEGVIHTLSSALQIASSRLRYCYIHVRKLTRCWTLQQSMT